MAKIAELVAEYIDCGCQVAHLGRAKVPAGYAIMLNADESHYFWINERGKEGPIHWNKWKALAMAKANSQVEEQPHERT